MNTSMLGPLGSSMGVLFYLAIILECTYLSGKFAHGKSVNNWQASLSKKEIACPEANS